MKVVLVNPPLRRQVSANVPGFVERERGTYPPIGLLSIAAYLRERGPSGVRVKVLDAALTDLSDQQIEKYFIREAPDIIGVQALTFTLLDVLTVARIAKQVNPDVKIVLGGRHCDIYPIETIALPGIDFVITGEGELAFTRLVGELNNLEALRSLAGLTFIHGGRVINNPPQLIDNLDDLPFPARDLTAHRDYRYLLAKKNIFTTLITSRGCPFGCTFCDEGHKKFRAFSAPRVVAEILDCKRRLGIEQFFIFDSTFTADRQRVMDICSLLVEQRAAISFDMRSRLDLVDDEMLIALKRAGCRRIQYGVESGNDNILSSIGKNITLDQVREAVVRTRAHGFDVLCDFMIGLPGETEREIQDTIRLALDLPINYVHFAITMPYPNTELYKAGMEKGLFGDYWREFSCSPTADFRPRVWEEHVNRERLTSLMMDAYKRFYFRPSLILQELLHLRSLSELFRKAKGGLRLMLCAVKSARVNK